MTSSPLDTYQRRVAAGSVSADPAQAAAVEVLDRLADAVTRWQPSAGLMSRWFGSRPGPAPRGLYLWGGVGRGKTMLMDLFYETIATTGKQRLHFHEFMSGAHDLIAAARKANAGDPIPQAAERIVERGRLICFDELHVTDIADAMILGRLFRAMFERGVVVVATSNAEPGDLYRNGLNRALFLPFIDLIETHMDVLELKSARDYRLEKLTGRQLYFTPLGAEARAGLDRVWDALTADHAGEPMTLHVKGREVHVPRAAHGVARFAFDELCERPLGASDYLAIAHAFHTVVIDDVPALGPERRNAARRLITLVDALYDQRVGLIVSAEVEPHLLYTAGDGATLFERTVSRLIEMRSAEYIADRASRHLDTALVMSEGIALSGDGEGGRGRRR